jgi:hypothetical protein
VPIRHEATDRAGGIFQIRLVVHPGGRPREVGARLRGAGRWFGEHLPAPDHLRRSQRDAIFWFKCGSGEPLRRARLLASWLRSRGFDVETVQTTDPGEIFYEDRWQVAARPRADTYSGRVLYEAYSE